MLAGLGGLLMAVGLGLAELTDPRRIVGFLDFTGGAPSVLVFVLGMTGGMVLHAFVARRAQGRPRPAVQQRRCA